MADFALLVCVIGGKPTRYAFDQDSVLVGRGPNADLRIEHAAVARSQFVLERQANPEGDPRYRIMPYDATNPTYVNERRAVEGILTPGDIIAVGDIRIVLERRWSAKAPSARTATVPLLRPVLIVGAATMALAVGYVLFFTGEEEAEKAELTAAQTKLFVDTATVTCANQVECETRARDAYSRGKKLLTQVGADPGNWYRAAIELERAARFATEVGRPISGIADVGAQLEATKTRADAEFNDARFRLQRAIATGDLRRQAEEAAMLARIVPDDTHPFRIKLDAYRRQLPKSHVGGGDEVTP